jgi:hypothetical protein
MAYLNILKRLYQQAIFRLARFFLNGNAAKLEIALAEARRLKQSLAEFDRVRRECILSNVEGHPESVPVEAIDEFYREWLLLAVKLEDRLGNLLTIIFGFGYLREQIAGVQQWYADADNVRRLNESDDQIQA